MGPASHRWPVREATAEDAPTIHAMVRGARLFPFDLIWQRFIVAEGEGNDHIIGCGQMRRRGSVRELSSLVVQKEHRRKKVGTTLVHALLAREQGDVYLLCRPRLVGYYNRFDFEVVSWWKLPWLLKLKLFPILPLTLFGRGPAAMARFRTSKDTENRCNA